MIKMLSDLTVLLLLFAIPVSLLAFPNLPKHHLTIDREFVYAAADLDEVWNIDICTDLTASNWFFATNIIGQGSNAPPEMIDIVTTNGNRFYRIHPE